MKDRWGAIRNGEGKGIHKVALPIGTIVIRKLIKNGDLRRTPSLVRFIKVAMEGPPQKRWMLFAKWRWEKEKGPVPAGKCVLHMDGDTMNDELSNLAVGGHGDRIALAHLRDPEWSKEQHRRCAQGAAEHNRLRGLVKRSKGQSPGMWYPVWDAEGLVFNVPFRKRKALLAWFGVDVSAYPANGRARRWASEKELVIRAVKGLDLRVGILESYWIVDPETELAKSLAKGDPSRVEERRLVALSRGAIWRRAQEAAKVPPHERSRPEVYSGRAVLA